MRCWLAFVIRPKRCLIAWRPEASMCPGRGKEEVVRALYVATRNQVRALAACLELEGLE